MCIHVYIYIYIYTYIHIYTHNSLIKCFNPHPQGPEETLNPQLICIHIHQLFRILYTLVSSYTVNFYWWWSIIVCRVLKALDFQKLLACVSENPRPSILGKNLYTTTNRRLQCIMKLM